jgi:hypothetical protein
VSVFLLRHPKSAAAAVRAKPCDPIGSRGSGVDVHQSIDLNSPTFGIGRHVTGVADPFSGHIDECRIAHVQRSDGWIETTWNNSDLGAFSTAGPRSSTRGFGHCGRAGALGCVNKCEMGSAEGQPAA